MKIKIVQVASKKPGGRICPWAVDNLLDAERK
jgi:hypothetical protein